MISLLMRSRGGLPDALVGLLRARRQPDQVHRGQPRRLRTLQKHGARLLPAARSPRSIGDTSAQETKMNEASQNLFCVLLLSGKFAFYAKRADFGRIREISSCADLRGQLLKDSVISCLFYRASHFLNMHQLPATRFN